jgi:hypothetical protein
MVRHTAAIVHEYPETHDPGSSLFPINHAVRIAEHLATASFSASPESAHRDEFLQADGGRQTVDDAQS